MYTCKTQKHIHLCKYDTYPDIQDSMILRNWALEIRLLGLQYCLCYFIAM